MNAPRVTRSRATDENATKRYFNTAGPVRPDRHYCIPPLERLDLQQVLALIRTHRYFVVHAPRHTGKTSVLLALRDLLNSGTLGDYRCLYVNFEPGQAAGEDVGDAMAAILDVFAKQLRRTLGDTETAVLAESMDTSFRPYGALGKLLTAWAEGGDTPAVLLIDEADALVGNALNSVLRQLRVGFVDRPDGFPQSVVLCGVRDVREHRFRGPDGQVIRSGVPFNIVAWSLRLGDFSDAEVGSLLAQHTDATGQGFEEAAVRALWDQTRGQPGLVNALAQEMCFEDDGTPRAIDGPLTEGDVFDACEAFVLRREAHLERLADKLREPRVRRVIEPIVSGGYPTYDERDWGYVQGLGLVAPDAPLRIANPIYAEMATRT